MIWKSRARVRDDKKQSMEWTNRHEGGCKTLLKWILILIAAKRKSTQKQSWKEKLWKKKLPLRIQQPLKRSKKGLNKICIREDPSKYKMVFSEESRQAIFDMGIVEHIELKTSRIKAPFFRTSKPSSRGCKHGPNLWQEHHKKAVDALRGAKKKHRHYASIWDRWQNDEVYRQSQLAHDWSQMRLWDTWIILRTLISHKKRRKSKDRNENLLFLRSAIDEKQGLPLTQRPGYKEAKNVLIDMQKFSRKDLGVQFIRKSERKREHDKIDPITRTSWVAEH